MSTEPTGLAGAALDRAADAAPDVEPELGFFPSVADVDAMPRVHGRLQKSELRAYRARGQRGRPPGSRNKRNVTVAAYFVGKYGHPLDVFGEIMSRPLDVLIDEMEAAQGGDAKHKPVRAIDAMRLKLEAANAAAPYIEGKQPVSVEVSRRKDMVLVVPGLSVAGEGDAEEVRAAIEEHGLAAIDPDSGELVMRATRVRYDPLPDDDGDDGGSGADA